MRRLLVAVACLLFLAACPPRVRFASCGDEQPATDIRSDSANCGGCHRACPEGSSCIAGECSEPEGLTLCEVPGGDPDVESAGRWGPPARRYYAALASDTANCGACDIACPPGSPCEGGRCVCPEGRTVCPVRDDGPQGSRTAGGDEPPLRYCADTTTDRDQCGGCGLGCEPWERCRDGRCVSGDRFEADEFRERDGALRAAHDHLLILGREAGFAWDAADAIDVVLPDGAAGVLVALGFSGPARGYLVLFRIAGDEAVPVAVEEGPIDWGIRSLRDEVPETLRLERLTPLADPTGHGSFVRAVGAGHAGTGEWVDGFVLWVEVRDDGLESVYTGIDLYVTHGLDAREERCRREVADLDGDGTIEIVERCRACSLEQQASGERVEVDCAEEQRLEYRWDGRSWQ
jgi:hypothetical protein